MVVRAHFLFLRFLLVSAVVVNFFLVVSDAVDRVFSWTVLALIVRDRRVPR